MNIILTMLVTLSLMPNLALFADDDSNQSVAEIFGTHFFEQYESRKCGVNIMKFIDHLHDEGHDLSDFSIVQLKNKGFSVFGMINAEKARGTRFNKPSANEMNWHHHVIAIDKKNNVYDFDFQAVPTISKFHNYIEAMFLDEPECRGRPGGRFCVGRKTKLDQYELTFISAQDYINKNEETSFVGTLRSALKFSE